MGVVVQRFSFRIRRTHGLNNSQPQVSTGLGADPRPPALR